MLADAEEALAELECRMGLLEPEECEFCVGIARRSMREAWEVVPKELRGELREAKKGRGMLRWWKK